MDPIQIPVPTTPIATQTVEQPVPQVPVQAAPQDDFFDKFLKGLVEVIGKLVKPAVVAPTVPLGVTPQVPSVPEAPQAPANIFNTIGSGIENVANQAVNVAQTGVNSVVQNAQNYIAEPAAPAQSSAAVQSFLSQNYQSMPTVNAAPEATPVATPVVETPVATTPVVPTEAPTQPVTPIQ
jgi:hypothetical protein